MESWWQELTTINKAFCVQALFFSLLFLWQLAGMLLGADGSGHGDGGHMPAHDAPGESGHGDAHDNGSVVFSLISVRSIVAFGTLFSWAGSLYLMGGTSPVWAVLYSLLWGLAAMFLVSYLMFGLLKLQQTEKASLWSAVGEEATVYMNIPEDGVGKVRVMVRGTISFVNARSAHGEPLKEGRTVRVLDLVDDKTVSVAATDD
jgi:hypothetical protein